MSATFMNSTPVSSPSEPHVNVVEGEREPRTPEVERSLDEDRVVPPPQKRPKRVSSPRTVAPERRQLIRDFDADFVDEERTETTPVAAREADVQPAPRKKNLPPSFSRLYFGSVQKRLFDGFSADERVAGASIAPSYVEDSGTGDGRPGVEELMHFENVSRTYIRFQNCNFTPIQVEELTAYLLAHHEVTHVAFIDCSFRHAVHAFMDMCKTFHLTGVRGFECSNSFYSPTPTYPAYHRTFDGSPITTVRILEESAHGNWRLRDYVMPNWQMRHSEIVGIATTLSLSSVEALDLSVKWQPNEVAVDVIHALADAYRREYRTERERNLTVILFKATVFSLSKRVLESLVDAMRTIAYVPRSRVPLRWAVRADFIHNKSPAIYPVHHYMTRGYFLDVRDKAAVAEYTRLVPPEQAERDLEGQVRDGNVLLFIDFPALPCALHAPIERRDNEGDGSDDLHVDE